MTGGAATGSDGKERIAHHFIEALGGIDWQDASKRAAVYDRYTVALDSLIQRYGLDDETAMLWRSHLASLRDKVDRAVPLAADFAQLKTIIGGEGQDHAALAPAPEVVVAAPAVDHEKRSGEPSPPAVVEASRRGLPRWAIGLGGVLLLSQAALAYTVWSSGGECSTTSTTCYDSGWVKVDSLENRQIVLQHTLGVHPTQYSLWFSPEPNSDWVQPLAWSWGGVNPTTVRISKDKIEINVFSGAPLATMWSAKDGNWTYWKEGYLRIKTSK